MITRICSLGFRVFEKSSGFRVSFQDLIFGIKSVEISGFCMYPNWGVGGWYRLSAVLDFGEPKKKVGFNFDFKFKALPDLWQSLLQDIPGDNRRSWLQSQWPSSWGSAPAQIRWISTKPCRQPCKVCGHVVAGFVEPTKPGNILFNVVDSESRVPVLQAAMQTKNCENRNSLNNFIITLWSAFPCLKIRWSSEHSFISVFESIRWFRQPNNPDSLYSSALLDALHRALHAWAQNGISRFGPTTQTT